MGRHEIARARRLVEDLREMGGESAPRGFAGAVMTRLGLGDLYWRIESPIGPVLVAASPRGIAMVARNAAEAEFARAFSARFGRPIAAAATPPADLAAAVQRHLAGQSAALRFDLSGLSEFERAVLLKALEIPRGEVRPYAWIAREIGHPAAVRAVGTALRRNPIPLLIPCHRVVKSDGQLGRYALGAAAKGEILAAEGIDVSALAGLTHAGVRFWGSDTTRIFCFPTCRHARRIAERHRVPFASAATAAEAGYRPCKVCRPAVAS